MKKKKGFELYTNGELAIEKDEPMQKGEKIAVFRPEVNLKVTFEYMSDEDFAKLDEKFED